MDLLDVGLRFRGFAALLDGLRRSGLSETITPGCSVVARRDCAQHGIVEAQTYVCEAIYYQGVNSEGLVARVHVSELAAASPAGCEGWTQYVRLYSERYHTAPVVVRPDEAGLVSMRAEIAEALRIAIPIAIVCAFVDAAFAVLAWLHLFLTHVG